MQNYWTTFKRNPPACWYVTLPSVAVAGVDPILRFAKNLLSVGEKEKVFRILHKSDANIFGQTLNYSYFDYLVETMNKTGILPLFSASDNATATKQRQIRTASQICYYDKSGSIVEEEVENLGQLLERLRPDKVKNSMGYMSHVAPIVISGLTIINVQDTRAESIYLSISLDTDIWFPWVVGFLDNADPPSSLKDMFDNRELALRHTTRLNRFLNFAYDLVQELGGEWELAEPDGTSKYYESMCRIDGIDLNPTGNANV